MSQGMFASMKLAEAAVVAALIVFAFAATPANADPCAVACRSEHNACRMAAKLLFSPRCDAQLQACISQCFAAGRFNRGQREDRAPAEFRDHRGPPEMRDPPDMRRPPEMRGPPGGGPPGREFHGDRDRGRF